MADDLIERLWESDEANSLTNEAAHEITTARAEIEQLRGALGKTFCVVFLDGRNEHGTHVIPSFPMMMNLTEEDISEWLAEEIFSASEKLGYGEGDHVWVEFYYEPPHVGEYGRVELEGYWCFSRINDEMTRIVCRNEPRANIEVN